MRARRLVAAALLAVVLIYSFSASASGPIQFSPADSYPLSATQFRMTSGDFNRDGWPDLVVVQDNNTYSVLMNNGAGGFTTATYTIVGAQLRDAVVVNLAGDTVPDLVLSDWTGAKIRVLTGTGTGTFNLLPSVNLTSNGEGIAAGDFNGDGYPDVAVCLRNANQLNVLLGTPGGSFGAPAPYGTGNCNDLAVGYVNGGTALDIVTANWSTSNISVLLGSGNGTFGTSTPYAVGGNATDVALADVNHDGKLDAVVAAYSISKAVIMLGNGAGAFSVSQSLSVITGPQQVRVADFNQDGFLDIATANASGAPGMALLQATGYNTFMAAAPFHPDQPANGLAIADFNRDTGPDVATSHTNNTVRVMKVIPSLDSDSDGMPDWWENQYACLNPLAGDSALDADSDGLRNLEEYAASHTDPCLYDTDGDGLGDGSEFTIFHTDPNKVDTDNDGMPDGWEADYICLNPLAADAALDADSDWYNNLAEYQGGHDPCFAEDTDADLMPDGWEDRYTSCGLNKLANDAGLDPDGDYLTNLEEFQGLTNPCVVNDFDGDAMPDYWEEAHACMKPQQADAALDYDIDSYPNLYEYQHDLDPCLAEDTDGDGMPDGWEDKYASCGLNKNLNDAGLDPDLDLLTNLQEYQGGTNPCLATDSDGDGMPDFWELAHACMNPAVADAGLDYDGDGSANLQEYQHATDPCLADSDGDGMLDGYENQYACLNPLANDAALDPDGDGGDNLYESGLGSDPCVSNAPWPPVFFATTHTYSVGAAPYRMAAGDFNRDSRPDLVVVAQNASESILLNDGAGGFTAKPAVAGGSPDVAVVNLAGDSIPDLVFTDYSVNYLRYFTGNGDGTFTAKGSMMSGYQGPDGLVSGEFNGDGYVDVAVCNRTGKRVTIFLGTAGGGFSQGASYYLNSAVMEIAAGYLDAGPTLDLVTANYTTGTISILLGQGNGTFAVTASIGPFANVYDVALGDLNGDGKTDAAAATAAGVVILWGDGAGGFPQSRTFATASVPTQVRIADLNQDGFPDLAASNQSAPGLSVIMNYGHGFWGSAFSFSPDQAAGGLAIADFDPASLPDVATSQPGANTVRIGQGRVVDTDHDLLADITELAVGTDPADPDSDGDGMKDGVELIFPCLNPLVSDAGADYDGDCVSSLAEYEIGFDPCTPNLDHDGDVMDSCWESLYPCMNPTVADAGEDPDHDTWNNYNEWARMTDPCGFNDADGDQMPDGWEQLHWCVNYLTGDSTLDPDGDLMDNLVEYLGDTDPCVSNDADGDGMSDIWEQAHPCMDPLVNDANLDYDGDLLNNIGEYIHGYDPCVYDDTDNDGMPNGWEFNYWCLNPVVNDAALDPDLDTINNLAEYLAGSDPCVAPDTDADGMPDWWELAHPCMDPAVTDGALDYDSDYYSNLNEYQSGGDPCVAEDTDGDGMIDGWEDLYAGCGLNKAVDDAALDPDLDTVTNLAEYLAHTNPCVAPDTDADGMPDWWEQAHPCMNPALSDPYLDYDHDSRANLSEYLAGTDPCVAEDTDSDGLPDGWEELYSWCGLDKNTPDAGGDPDADTLTNLQEYQAGANPCVSDTDSDGMPDGWEVSHPCLRVNYPDSDLDYDRDFAPNLAEYQQGLDPCLAEDTDGDQMTDGWEALYAACVNPAVNDAALDPDNDGADNLLEFQAGGDPCAAESWWHDPVAFNRQVSYPVSTRPLRLTTGDFNGDGFDDIVAVHDTNRFSILLNQRNGTFSNTAYPIGNTQFKDVAVVQVAGDTIPDLVFSSNSTSQVRVYLGAGNGTFILGGNYAAGGAPTGLAAGDFNGDGYPDVAVCVGSNNLAFLRGNSSGGFDAPVNLPMNASCVKVAAGRVDAGPTLDLVAATYDRINVFLGDGAGGFSPANPIGAGNGNSDLALGDLNNDGYLDAVLSSLWSYSVVELLGDGAGGFRPFGSFGAGMDPAYLTLGDLNGDGRLDLAIASYSTDLVRADRVSVFLNYGNGRFHPLYAFHSGQEPIAVAIADFDHRYTLDLATTFPDSNAVRVIFGVRTDRDADVLADLEEPVKGTDPEDPDTDADLMPDGFEVAVACLNPGADDAAADPDGDLIANLDEYHQGTNPCVLNDADGDGMADAWELLHPCLNPAVADGDLDYDQDSWTNLHEFQHATDPCLAEDTDLDGMPDGWEELYSSCGLDKDVPDADLDPDADLLTNLYEFQHGFNPCVLTDTDGDGMPNGWEFLHPCLDPNLNDGVQDYDADSWTNLHEYQHATDPCVLEDTDADGLPDGWEELYASCGLDPNVSDAGLDPDADLVTNLNEFLGHTNPCVQNDADADGMPDIWEQAHACMNPAVADAGLDYDSDLLTNLVEYQRGMDPCVFTDTDGDLMPDGWEELYASCGLNPNFNDAGRDPDADYLTNLDEYQGGTSPCVLNDADGDGLPDGWEDQYQSCGFNPLSFWSEKIGKAGTDLRISSALFYGYAPSLAWTGSEFGVNWCNYHNDYDIYFGRVSAAGEKIGADVEAIDDPQWSMEPSLAWTGSEFGMSWHDFRFSPNPEIFFARVSADGVRIGGELRVTDAVNTSYNPALVWTGSEFGVSWEDHRDGNDEIYFARISADGAKIGADLRVTNAWSTSVNPSLAWTGSEFGVSWREWRDDNSEIYFARVSASGAKIDDDLRVTSDPADSSNPSLAWTGSEFGLSWNDERDGNYEIYFTRLAAAGVKIGGDLRITRDPAWSGLPTLAWTGSRFGLIWQDQRAGNYEIFFAFLSAAGAGIGEVLRVTSAPGTSEYPALAWTGSEFGVSWDDDRDGTQEPYFVRISGQASDKDGDGLGEDQEYARGTNPCVADTDGDGLTDGYEVYNSLTNPLGADSDGDGLGDGYEVNTSHTNPLDWDSDSDRLPDKFEVDNAAHAGGGLDPMNALDGAADYDGDGNSNKNEYWNGSDPWTKDPVPGVYANPGCYYWADGDGDGIPAPSDIIMLKLEIAGAAQMYRFILPHGIDTLDLDRDGYAAPADLIALKLMIAGSERPGGYPSQALSLETVSAPTGSVAAGSTTHVTVSVHSVSGTVPYAAGFGVVFTVVSGNAVLLGGDGTADGEAAGNRYDFSMESALGARAKMVVLVTGPGPVTIGAKIPGCGTYPNGRWNDEVVLSPVVVFNEN